MGWLEGLYVAIKLYQDASLALALPARAGSARAAQNDSFENDSDTMLVLTFIRIRFGIDLRQRSITSPREVETVKRLRELSPMLSC